MPYRAGGPPAARVLPPVFQECTVVDADKLTD
jgi:hypothetical protein